MCIAPPHPSRSCCSTPASIVRPTWCGVVTAGPDCSHQVTEESLATFFADCGTVMDCRICGDPNSAMRFAFIEFMEEMGAQEVRRCGCG